MPYESRILLNNEPIITGGERSCQVIYNNLTGTNFPRPSWSDETYEQYLAYMEWAGGITYQGTLALEQDGEIIAQHIIEPHQAPAEM